MPSINNLRKAKLTVSINNDIAVEIDKIAKKRKTPRSKILEELLRDSLIRIRKQKIEEEIKNYYQSLSETEMKEDKEWSKISAESAKRLWND